MRFFILILLIACYSSAFGQRGTTSHRKSAEIEDALDTLSVDLDKRYAMIIGNAAYDPGRLKNPVNDADSVSQLLARYGFQITKITNAPFRTLMDSIRVFSNRVKSNRGMALVYFSGHGVQHQATNYLVPLQASMPDTNSIQSGMVALDSIINAISYSFNGLNIIVLDACRNSPFQSMPGVQKGMTYNLKKWRNTLVFFSTSANEVADDGEGANSPFTDSFVEVIRRYDSIELFDITKQVTKEVDRKTNRRQYPQTVGNISDDFYFKKGKFIPKPKLFIVSVGIDKYADSTSPAFYHTNYCAKGAVDFTSAFSRGKELYDSIVTITLTDGKATRRNFLVALESLRDKITSKDVLFIYFNGRVINTELEEESQLLFSDTNLEENNATGLTIPFIARFLRAETSNIVYFIDGDRGVKMPLYRTPLNAGEFDAEPIILSSAEVHQYSQESAQFQGSLFTYALLKGFKNAVSRRAGNYVDIMSLSRYVEEKVNELTNNRQSPTSSYFPQSFRNFIILPAAPEQEQGNPLLPKIR